MDHWTLTVHGESGNPDLAEICNTELTRFRAQRRTSARGRWFRRVPGGLQRLAGARPRTAECRGPSTLPGPLQRGLASPPWRRTVCLSTSLTPGRSRTALTHRTQWKRCRAAPGAGLALSTSCFLEASHHLKSATTLRSPCCKKETVEDRISHGGSREALEGGSHL